MMKATEVRAIAEAADGKIKKLRQEHAEMDVKERIMPSIIKAAGEGKYSIYYTVDPFLSTYVAKILKDLGYSVTEAGYKYIVKW